MTAQRAERCGNWEDRLPSLFLKVLRFWGESNVAWQKSLCATTPGRWSRAAQENQGRQAQPCIQDPWRTLHHMAYGRDNACTAKCTTTIFRQYPSGHRPDVFKESCWVFFFQKQKNRISKSTISDCIHSIRLVPRHLTPPSDWTHPTNLNPHDWQGLWFWVLSIVGKTALEPVSTHTALTPWTSSPRMMK